MKSTAKFTCIEESNTQVKATAVNFREYLLARNCRETKPLQIVLVFKEVWGPQILYTDALQVQHSKPRVRMIPLTIRILVS